jgi:IMP dehydrogenase
MAEIRKDDGLTFDDVLLVPGYSEVLPSEVDVSSQLTQDILVNILLFPRRWIR